MVKIIMLGPGRDKELGIDPKMLESRAKKNKKLEDPIAKMATFLAEGQAFGDGLIFATGADLAYFLNSIIKFSVATLQEQGYLSKKLPAKAASESEPAPQTGQYL